MVNGDTVEIEASGDTLEINGESMVICGNVTTANATVHIVDTVLMLPGVTHARCTGEGPGREAGPQARPIQDPSRSELLLRETGRTPQPPSGDPLRPGGRRRPTAQAGCAGRCGRIRRPLRPDQPDGRRHHPPCCRTPTRPTRSPRRCCSRSGAWRPPRPRRRSCRTWIATIAHRRAVDRVRSEQAERNRRVHQGVRIGAVDPDPTARPAADAAERAEVLRARPAHRRAAADHRPRLLRRLHLPPRRYPPPGQAWKTAP